MRLAAAACMSIALGAGPAAATASLSCDFSDANLTFASGASLSTGLGGNFMTFNGTAEIAAKAVPEDLRRVELSIDHLKQRWLHGGDLKLRLYHERPESEPHGYVELVIETRRARRGKADLPDEIEYRGSYVLTIYPVPTAKDQTLTLRGAALCSVG